MKVAVYIVLLSTCLACNKRVPFGIMEQNKMETLLWEQMKVDAYIKEYVATDPKKNANLESVKLQQLIFIKHNTNKKDFYKSYNYYLQHDELLKPLLDSIVAKQTINRDNETLRKYRSLQPFNWQAPFKHKVTVILPPFKIDRIFIVQDTLVTAPVSNSINVLQLQKLRQGNKQKTVDKTTYKIYE